MALFAFYLYDGEIDHLTKSIQHTKKVSDKIFVFSSSEKIKSLEGLKKSNPSISIHEVEWSYDFSKIRNYAIDVICKEAKLFDWILHIDSDECIDPQTCWKINSFLDMYGHNTRITGFRLQIVNNSEYWLSEQSNEHVKNKRKLYNRSVRIFRASKDIRFKGSINEMADINPSMVQDMEVRIFHHAHRYSQEEEAFLKERQKVFNKWSIISQADRERYIEEEKLFRKKTETKLSPLREKNQKPIIGFFCLHYEPPIGGAERSMHNYFSELKDDYDIEVFCFLNDDGQKFVNQKQMEIDGVKITQSPTDIAFCVNNFCKKNPDIVITQLLCSEIVIDISYRNNIPCIYFAHSFFEDVCQHYLLQTCPETNLSTCAFGSHCANAKRHVVQSQKYSRCSSIICNSLYTKKIFDRFFPSISDKIKVIHPNFQFDIFRPIEKEKTGKVLAVNTSQSKGRNVVINLAHMNPDIQFVYVDSRERDLQGIPIPKNIEFRGKLSRKEMSKVYREVDAVLYPTLMDETFGGVPCEAILSGTPVVCPNKGNLPNLVAHEKTGYIVYNTYEKEAWSEALHKAMNMEFDHEKRESLLSGLNVNRNKKEIKLEIDKCLKFNENNEVYVISDRKSNPVRNLEKFTDYYGLEIYNLEY